MLALLGGAMLLLAARPPEKAGALILDAANPVIAVELSGVPMRLRVSLDQRDSVSLNPDAAARLPLEWEQDRTMMVGRVALPSEMALATLKVGGMERPLKVSQHFRLCCAGVDGEVGPDLLPYASVHLRRASAPPPTKTRTFPLDASATFGLSTPDDGLMVRFDPALAETVAASAGGAILTGRWGGRWAGPPGSIVAAFGISRPARRLVFARPGRLAGFHLPTLLVRIADFEGREALPDDPVDPGDILVRRPIRRQFRWPAVTLGGDRLRRCVEIAYIDRPRSLRLTCAFDGP